MIDHSGAAAAFARLLDIMTTLRGPNGCPWDREQTHTSICTAFIEELHEFIEAVDDNDAAAMQDELGDLCLHIVFQAQIAHERGEFTIEDALNNINAKLIRRHPHVFGAVTVETPDDVVKNWEQIKKTERTHAARASVTDGIPRHLPALSKARKLQSKVGKVGFDWEHVDDVLAKVDEELREVRTALAAGRPEDVREELGDLLFAVVNVARFVDVDPERALQQTVRKFIRRFCAMETEFARRGKRLEDSTLAEMDAAWERAKQLSDRSD
jgi:tetrapyrrole methylase family protein/MazG family protein